MTKAPDLTAEEIVAALASMIKDPRNYHGVTIDHVPSVDGEPSGFRLLRRHYISEPYKSLERLLRVEVLRQ
ncbi:hypothetical protein CcrC1_gp217c [Caulobacter phage C1]|nr:hypothetical protein CcrC1_gp217c [Caulobacter phage C1]UTU08446.1 hypothetical protein CcrC2_gp218c [Caulobacter phage C2]UTU08963.1 hypothetical protein CcrJ4_gp212c [Caulobacter phage J4]UTU09521.1 hypothetical protein CcrBL47_gp235c [Caulobacter phage BL47]UTU10079.1 hypothetical protein CcrRB23_gp217c [Caulobacter phage RB23]WGN97114.1 hypothetical protein [Bertelyvirus sp.]